MKRFDFQTIFGGGLVLLGLLMLLEKFGFIRGAASLFWGVALLLGAAWFLVLFGRRPTDCWWAIIPGMALLGMGGSAILPQVFHGLAGGFFLGVLGLAFFIIYLADHSRWWGLIPGGVLVTLGVVASLGAFNPINSGGLFFIGLGLTFLLVAVAPNPSGKMQWAYIPAVVLVIIGALLGSQSDSRLADYIWPAALIITGLAVLGSFFFRKD